MSKISREAVLPFYDSALFNEMGVGGWDRGGGKGVQQLKQRMLL